MCIVSQDHKRSGFRKLKQLAAVLTLDSFGCVIGDLPVDGYEVYGGVDLNVVGWVRTNTISGFDVGMHRRCFSSSL
jgi:hypothetical protein